MNASPVNPGDILVGKYRVDRVLGMGAMGVVVAATHITLTQRVALKFMLGGAGPSEQAQERFLREARAAVHLKTQHVAKVLDVGKLESGAPYMVMELLDGRDLAAVLKARGPMPVADAVELVLQACEAVAEAHAAGIVHRDLKPANLFLTKGADGGPCVKVIDFGISKHTGAELALTSAEEAIGSPLYMSPEQIRRSSGVDARTDIWSLGIVLYELVAGVTPFQAEGIMELCTKVNFEPPTPLSAYRPDAPAGFEAVLLQTLEKDRTRRYENVARFAAALAPFTTPRAAMYAEHVAGVLGEQIAPARPTDVLPPEVATAAPAASNAATGAAVVRATKATTEPSGRATIVAGAAAVVVLTAIGFAAGFWWLTRPGPTMPAAPGSAEVAPVASSAAPPPTVAATAESPPVAAPSATAPASTARSRPAVPAKPAATTAPRPPAAPAQPRKDPYAQ